MKKTLIKLVITILFVILGLENYAQKPDNYKKKDSINSENFKSSKGKLKNNQDEENQKKCNYYEKKIQYDEANRIIKFSNGKSIEVKLGQTNSISPRSERVAILNFGNLGAKETDVSIYDKNGVKLGNYKVEPLDKIAISDDGRLVLYGFLPTEGKASTSQIYFYNDKIQKIDKPLQEFGAATYGTFSNYGNYFVFIAYAKNFTAKNMKFSVSVYDDKFNILKIKEFEEWPKYSDPVKIDIDEKNKKVTIYFQIENNKNISTSIKEVNF